MITPCTPKTVTQKTLLFFGLSMIMNRKNVNFGDKTIKKGLL